MMLFGHHIAVELFGREFSPQTPLEHAITFGLTGLLLALTAYGAYAAIRDLRRRLRHGREQKALPNG